MYHNGEIEIPCSWEGCRKKAVAHIFNSTMTDSAWLCGFHKKVASINLEQHDKIHAPSADRAKNVSHKPGVASLPKITPERRPSKDGVEQWAKDAARKAETAAAPLDQAIINQRNKGRAKIVSDLPTPRKTP